MTEGRETQTGREGEPAKQNRQGDREQRLKVLNYDFGKPLGHKLVTKKKLHKCSKEEAATRELGGFVKGLVTYLVADDLVIQPMSTISCINVLKKFNAKEVGSLEERVVDLGMDETTTHHRLSRPPRGPMTEQPLHQEPATPATEHSLQSSEEFV
ncbi:unnamed protein product [Ilex paraguariensis]|uniref:Uncharacterized protein n=1 Tax=Ilex paraguariensis TaxID=185542 RepID=A0ABC8T1B0_9AQUA